VSQAAHRRITGRIVIATHNPGKLKELRELLAPYGIDAVSAGELGLAEPEETGASFRANARIKAQAAADAAKLPAFADDSGLVVEALDGAPGIHSARWAGENKDFAGAMAKIEDLLREKRTSDRPSRAFRLRALRGLARRASGGIRRPRGRHIGLPAARHCRLRLRSDFPSRGTQAYLRRDDGRRKTRAAAERRRALAPCARLSAAGCGLSIAGCQSLKF
jgi:hypothetical protein